MVFVPNVFAIIAINVSNMYMKELRTEHKKEKIDYFVPIDTHCSAHERNPINLFCLDEKGI